MADDLPTARVIPKDHAERVAILRGQASVGARKAGRAAISVAKQLLLIALCGVGIVAIGAIGGRSSRSRAVDDLGRRMESLRRFDPLPKFDHLELQREIRLQVQRDLDLFQQPGHRRYQLQQLELVPEQIHQAR